MRKIVNIAAIVFLITALLRASVEAEEVFTWDACLAEAKKNHPDLIVAQEIINEQKASKVITASARLPQISATSDIKTAKTTTASATAGTVRAQSDSYAYGLSASQLVFDGFKTSNDIKAASENIAAAGHSYRFASATIRLNLRTTFIKLLKTQELIRVCQEIVKMRRDNLELITLRYQSGLEHRGALLTAEANLASATADLSQALRAIETYQRQLDKEMGKEKFQPVQVKGDFLVRNPEQNKPDFEQIAKNNPTLLKAISEKNSAAFSIKSAYANFAPEITGSAGLSKTTGTGLYRKPRTQWDVGLGVSVPIFEGGLQFAQLDQEYAQYRQAVANERSIRDGIVVSLQQNWVAFQDAQEAVEVQRKTLEAAQERSRISEAQYSIGFVTFDNWIIIENNLVSAKRSFLDAQANALLAEASWIQAKGETLEYAD